MFSNREIKGMAFVTKAANQSFIRVVNQKTRREKAIKSCVWHERASDHFKPREGVKTEDLIEHILLESKHELFSKRKFLDGVDTFPFPRRVSDATESVHVGGERTAKDRGRS